MPRLDSVMVSKSTPKAGHGVFRLQLVEGLQRRVWVSSGDAGFMLFETQYRDMGYSPAFEMLPTKKEWQDRNELSRPGQM
jgi:hypothetical protein